MDNQGVNLDSNPTNEMLMMQEIKKYLKKELNLKK